jgi:1-deoxy-D-xylulose-5-phosphate reductoisomerase
MRLPISYGVLYPERVDVGAKRVGFGGASWTFEKPRNAVFRCLPLAMEAGRAGGAYPVALNAANEVAVTAFLDRRIEFLWIARVIEEVLETVPEFGEMKSVEAVVDADRWGRERANKAIGAAR